MPQSFRGNNGVSVTVKDTTAEISVKRRGFFEPRSSAAAVARIGSPVDRTHARVRIESSGSI